MVYAFRNFRLDIQRRELWLGQREIPLQPRVFDLLLHLVRHRDRVVSKDELLETVWHDVIVTDGSLKRAVSLARAALREGGAEDAIRTYSRQGYRFDVDDVHEEGEPIREQDSLLRARAALAEGAWTQAAAAFAEVDADVGLDAVDLEAWGDAELFGGRAPQAVFVYERAVVAYSARSEPRSAARAALRLAVIHFERGGVPVARGLLRRAEALLSGHDEAFERGVLDWLACRMAVFEGDLDEAALRAERCLALGRRTGNLDLQLLGGSQLGLALVARGEAVAGFALHDEAAATVLSGPITPWVGGFVYCAMLWTCRHYGDWRRAAAWTDSFTRWCDQTSMSAFPGTCRLHRAEVLHINGDLARAEAEILGACDLLPDVAPYALGDAHRMLGDLRLARGELEAAEEAFRRAHELGWVPQPGLARVQLARGHATAALRGLERALDEQSWPNLQKRTLLLASLVTAAVAAGERQRAAEALQALEEHADPSVPAQAACLHESRAALRDGREAARELGCAIRAWQQVDAPLNVAHTRVRLARVLLDDGDPHAAELELSAARAVFAGVEAGAPLDEIDALLRQCG